MLFKIKSFNYFHAEMFFQGVEKGCIWNEWVKRLPIPLSSSVTASKFLCYWIAGTKIVIDMYD